MYIFNKNIILSGGTSGIGYELVKILHKDNHLTVISSNSENLLKLKNEFPDIKIIKIDLSKNECVYNGCKAIIQKSPCIDILINNAAIQNTPQFTDNEFCYDTIDKEVSINFTSICQITSKLLPALMKSNKSFILNINSALSLAPKKESAVYCATKAALNSLSKSLGYQLEQINVNVLQAFLPLIETPMTHGRGAKKQTSEFAAFKIIHGLRDEVKNNYIGKVRLLKILMMISPRIVDKIMKGF